MEGLAAGAADETPPKVRWIGRFVGTLAIACFWCGITGAFVGIVVWQAARALHAEARFARTEGTVLSSEVHAKRDSDGTTYRPLIRYRYTVDGKTYENDRYDFLGGSSSLRGRSKRIVAAHPPGRPTTVYYDPDDPQEAVLTTAVGQMTFFIALFLQPFIVVGLGMLGYVVWLPVRAMRLRRFYAAPILPPCRVPTWGRLREEMGGLSIGGRDGRGPAFVKAAVTSFGGACFAAVFVVMLLVFFAEWDSAWVPVGALLAAACVGVVAGLLNVGRVGRKARLHVDTSLGRLRLASPRRNVDLRFEQIESWTLRPIKDPHSAGSEDDLTFAPLLAVRTTGGREEPIHVFRPDEGGFYTARKLGRFFAAATGKPLAEPEQDADAEPPVPRSLREAETLARRAGQDYSDLT